MSSSGGLSASISCAQRATLRGQVLASHKPKRRVTNRAIAAPRDALPSIRRPWESSADCDDERRFLGPDVEEKAMQLQQLSSHFANEPYESVRARLHSVLVLLPDLASRVAFHNAEELDRLMQDPEALAESLLKLEEIFPGQDISQLVVADTRLADPAVVAALPKEIAKVKALLGIQDIAALFERRPLLLDSREVAHALAELEATLPEEYDARRMLVSVPALIYPANRKCLPSQLTPLQGNVRRVAAPGVVGAAMQVQHA